MAESPPPSSATAAFPAMESSGEEDEEEAEEDLEGEEEDQVVMPPEPPQLDAEGLERASPDHFKKLVSRQELVLREIQRKALDYSQLDSTASPGAKLRRDSSCSAVEGMLVQRELHRARVGERRKDRQEELAASHRHRNHMQEDASARRERQRKEQKEEAQRRFFLVHSRAKEFQKARHEIEQERERYTEAWYARLATGERHDRRALTPAAASPKSPFAGPMRSGFGDLSASLPSLSNEGGKSPRTPKAAPVAPGQAAQGGDVYEAVLKSRAFYASTMERWEGVVAQNDKRCAAYWQKISGESRVRKEQRKRISKRPTSKCPTPDGDGSPGGSRQPSRRVAAMEAIPQRSRRRLADVKDRLVSPGPLTPSGAPTRRSNQESQGVHTPDALGGRSSRPATGARPDSSLGRPCSARWEAKMLQCMKHWEEKEEKALQKWGSKSEAILEARRRIDDETRRRTANAALRNRRWQEKSGNCRKAVAESMEARPGLSAGPSTLSTSSSWAGATEFSRTEPPGLRWIEPKPTYKEVKVRETKARLAEQLRERYVEKFEKDMQRAAETQKLMAANYKATLGRSARHAEQRQRAYQLKSESEQELIDRTLQSLQAKNERIQGFHAKQSMSFLEKNRLMKGSRDSPRLDFLDLIQDISVPQGHTWEVDGSTSGLDIDMLGELATFGGLHSPGGAPATPRAAMTGACVSFASQGAQATEPPVDSEHAFLKEIEKRSERWLKELQRPRAPPQTRVSAA